ncbi:duboraya isoform X2 [Thunnus albacares]|uniref:duboraya isoform X2 n=1 Tax=Thunnus albacares TaxID=8236 RepID=UPI001CF69B42|nr:duboraya isoform X2 [Thunnus albacares]
MLSCCLRAASLMSGCLSDEHRHFLPNTPPQTGSHLQHRAEQEEAPSRRSVAELAGRFKGSAPPNNAAGNETEKPVRRRPPRSLQLPKSHGDDQECQQPPDVTSPGPGKAKRNSALIEKLQANLVLSPTALLPSPKSPGLRMLPPSFVPPFPGSALDATVTSSSTATPTSPVTVHPLTQEERPTSFEDPPTVAEGSILTSINKGRARHSIRRRPPSRRHRKSSSGDEVGVANDGGDTPLTSPSEPDGKTAEEEGGGGGEGEEEEMKEEKKKEEEDDGEKMKTEEENQEKSSGGKEEEEPMSVDSKEEKSEETTCQSST